MAVLSVRRAVLLLCALSAVTDAAASTERGGGGRNQRRGGEGGAEKRRRLHRIQHGQCSYTFILPELDGGCQGAASPPEHRGGSRGGASVVQRDSPRLDGEWSAQKLQQLENTMENNTQWLQKVGHFAFLGGGGCSALTERLRLVAEEKFRFVTRSVFVVGLRERSEFGGLTLVPPSVVPSGTVAPL